MGVLRVNVGGSWIDIPAGPPGAGIPPGGSTSSLLAKSSAADYATVWTNTLTAPLTIQTDTGGGGIASSQLLLRQTSTGSVEGGQIGFPGWGSSWTNDMYFDRVYNSFRFVYGGTVVGGFAGPGEGFMFGNHPVHAGTSYAAMWRTDKPGGSEYTLIQDNSGSTYLNSAGGQSLRFNIGNTAKMTIPPSGDLAFGAGMDGITFGYGPRIYTADATWVRANNLYASVESRSTTIGGESLIYTNGGPVRLLNSSDNNHRVQYSNGTPNQSGEASNGPVLNGYSSVWLHQEVGNKSFFLGSGGNVFINSGNAYQNFSSRRFKDDIETLDPHECLAMVRRWRPVRFRWKPENNAPHELDEGFISEEMYLTTPNLVNVTAHDAVEPDWPNAINYPGTAPWLAGAIQALITRIEALEAA